MSNTNNNTPSPCRVRAALFIDRDGTILREPKDEQIDSFDKFQFIPGVISALKFIAEKLDFELVMVSNQDGLGTPSYPEADFWPTHNLMLDILASEGIHFSDILIDCSFPHENRPTRKPGTAMLAPKYTSGDYDLAHSYVIGDRQTDAQLARNLGCKALILSPDAHPQEENCRYVQSWNQITEILFAGERRASVRRTTKETDIAVSLDLDGTGQCDIATGLGFFDHMLEQIARHGSIDLNIHVSGDLHVDEHHTIEDTALALGECLRHALGDKRGIERYGYSLPMDDCHAHVCLDFGGRPWLIWQTEFHRERIGDMPTEMFFHFFKSLSDAALINLYIQAEGQNEHHKIEAIFKALARSLRMALRRDIYNYQLPSSKGIL